MSVVGYTADADIYCPACAIEAYGKDIETEDIEDNEGNIVHPVFSWDEAGDTPDCCGACGEDIPTSWGPGAVTYAVAALKDALEEGRRNDTLDTWAEHLTWCGIDKREERIVKRYLRQGKRD